MDDTARRSTRARAGSSSRWSRAVDSRALYVFLLLPALLFLLAFVAYPLVYNFVMSFQEVTLRNLPTIRRPFIGFENYRGLVGDAIFSRVLVNTLVFTVANVALQLLLGLALAIFFQQGFPGSSYLRGLLVAGWMLPPMVIGAIWKWMFASDFGVINALLQGGGLTSAPIYWLSSPDNALAAVITANVWFGLPFNMILLAAGLSSLPKELYEAADIDGAGRWQGFRFITLPLMRATILAVVALSTIYTLRVFDLIWTMTGGGPVDATNIFPLWSYLLSFTFFDFGRGSAIATLLFVVVFAVSVVYVRSLASEERIA